MGFMNFLKEEDGQGTAEYAIILGIVVVAALGMLLAFKGKLQSWWDIVMNAA